MKPTGSRFGMYERESSETRVYTSVDLDGIGNAQIKTGIGFFDHMLAQVARHGLIDLVVDASGDLHVDEHHIVEDVGICLGKAVQQALGDMRGINRFGWAIVPMDEALAMVALDLSGRPLLQFEASFRREMIGTFPTELTAEFFRAFATHAGATLHIRLLNATNDHHAIEAIFKAFAKALEMATRYHPRQSAIPSTKGFVEGGKRGAAAGQRAAMIAIIDYGMGNLRSVQKAFEALGAPAQITTDPATIRAADAVVLPGVGAFGAAMARLHEAGLVASLRAAIENGKPFLGICLGLQLLFESSEESPGVEGLGILRGCVVGFQSHTGFTLPVPHIGWNQLLPVPSCPLWQGLPEQAFVYFVHSFYPEPAEPRLITAWCDYGVRFPCAVQQGNLFAVQFHPEKSGTVGLSILRNFLSIL